LLFDKSYVSVTFFEKIRFLLFTYDIEICVDHYDHHEKLLLKFNKFINVNC